MSIKDYDRLNARILTELIDCRLLGNHLCEALQLLDAEITNAHCPRQPQVPRSQHLSPRRNALATLGRVDEEEIHRGEPQFLQAGLQRGDDLTLGCV